MNKKHRLSEPFERSNTAKWRERKRIVNALIEIRDSAEEAYLCLDRVPRSDHDIAQASVAIGEMESAIAQLNARPKIVCLCGSTRFLEVFQQANLRETMAGNIVLSIGCNTKSDTDLMAVGGMTLDLKGKLDELHKRKIDLADEVLVLNVDGYIGNSTRSEIAYATMIGKPIRWLELVNLTAEK